MRQAHPHATSSTATNTAASQTEKHKRAIPVQLAHEHGSSEHDLHPGVVLELDPRQRHRKQGNPRHSEHCSLRAVRASTGRVGCLAGRRPLAGGGEAGLGEHLEERLRPRRRQGAVNAQSRHSESTVSTVKAQWKHRQGTRGSEVRAQCKSSQGTAIAHPWHCESTAKTR